MQIARASSLTPPQKLNPDNCPRDNYFALTKKNHTYKNQTWMHCRRDDYFYFNIQYKNEIVPRRKSPFLTGMHVCKIETIKIFKKIKLVNCIRLLKISKEKRNQLVKLFLCEVFLLYQTRRSEAGSRQQRSTVIIIFLQRGSSEIYSASL